MGVIVDKDDAIVTEADIETTLGTGEGGHGRSDLVGADTVKPGSGNGCDTVLDVNSDRYAKMDVGDTCAVRENAIKDYLTVTNTDVLGVKVGRGVGGGIGIATDIGLEAWGDGGILLDDQRAARPNE